MRAIRQAICVAVLLVLGAPLLAQEVDQFGKSHKWQGALEKLTVIDFAASWCAPCVRSLPRLDDLAASMPGVNFLVVSVDEKEAGRDFLVKELGLRLPVIWDSEHRIAEALEPEGMPSTFVLDSKGEVVYSHVGYDEKTWRELEEKIRKLAQ